VSEPEEMVIAYRKWWQEDHLPISYSAAFYAGWGACNAAARARIAELEQALQLAETELNETRIYVITHMKVATQLRNEGVIKAVRAALAKAEPRTT
jgi:hypothetical protein